MPSFRNLRWRYLFKEKKPSPDLVKKYGKFLAQLLVNRDLSEPPGRKPVPAHLKELEKAFNTIERYIKNNSYILVFGDYDVDGLTSTALFYNLLKEIGAKRVIPIVPERTEGYGLSPEIVKKFANYTEGKGLIVALDNGTKEVKTVELAKKLGLEVVIFDHHTPGDTVPDAVIVNPKLHKKAPQYLKDLSTVGLVFLFGLFLEKKGFELNAKRFLDLVALGTVADVSPLSELNFKLVREGLKLLSQKRSSSLGLLHMVERFYNKAPFSENDLAFKFVPRLNAFGRMDSARLGLKFLLTSQRETAKRLYEEMENLNFHRRRLTQQLTQKIVRKFRGKAPKGIVYASREIKKGVSGIIAGRLTSMWGVPSVVFASDGEVAVGSARSPQGLNIVKILEKLSPLLERWGGHSQAAGLSVKVEKLEEFKEAFLQEVQKVSWEPPEIGIDFPIEPTKFKEMPQLLELLKILEPYGSGNPYPTFVFEDILTDFVRTPYGYKLSFKRNGSYYMNLDEDKTIPTTLKGKKVRVVYTVRNIDRFDLTVEDFQVVN